MACQHKGGVGSGQGQREVALGRGLSNGAYLLFTVKVAMVVFPQKEHRHLAKAEHFRKFCDPNEYFRLGPAR